MYNDGNTENAPVPDLHGCPNISLLEGDNISSFFPINEILFNFTVILILYLIIKFITLQCCTFQKS